VNRDIEGLENLLKEYEKLEQRIASEKEHQTLHQMELPKGESMISQESSDRCEGRPKQN
jgi:hypothetical protein